MTRRITLFLLPAFEVLLIVLFVAWSAFASTLSQYKNEGLVPIEKCVQAMINGLVLQRVNQSQSDNTYITILFERRIYAFTYQRDSSDHRSSCRSWVETDS